VLRGPRGGVTYSNLWRPTCLLTEFHDTEKLLVYGYTGVDHSVAIRTVEENNTNGHNNHPEPAEKKPLFRLGGDNKNREDHTTKSYPSTLQEKKNKQTALY